MKDAKVIGRGFGVSSLVLGIISFLIGMLLFDTFIISGSNVTFPSDMLYILVRVCVFSLLSLLPILSIIFGSIAIKGGTNEA